MYCPHCKNSNQIIKRGSYLRRSDEKRIQRYYCSSCTRSFSAQTHSFDYRLRKRRINQLVFRLLAKGLSQRGSAQVLGVDPKTIARRVIRFGDCAKKHLARHNFLSSKCSEIVFDEMETFEHTKLKPLTIPMAVEQGNRRILAVDVGKIAAKGHLAKISLKKYGPRKCQRKKVLNNVFTNLKPKTTEFCIVKSDESQHYPKVVKKYFSDGQHLQYKGRRPAIIGQGEMKKGGYDPLFSFNQTAGMIRDNIKRLARRTWCTTKKIERLKDLLHIYIMYHNQRILGVKRPRMFNCLTPI